MRRIAPLLLVLLSSAACLAAQTPAKIIDDSIKASGGAKLLRATLALRMEGTVTNSQTGQSGAFTLLLKRPNRYYREWTFSSESLIEAYNGKSAWSAAAPDPPGTLLGADGQEIEAAARYYNSHLLDYKKDKLGLRYIGTAEIRGRVAQQIEVVWPTGVKRVVSFDARNHLILRETTFRDPGLEETHFEDYQSEKGLMVPRRIEYQTARGAYSVVVTRVERNGTAPERTFDFPHKSQVQLPDLKALFREIDANQKAIDKIRENYAGTRVEEETEYDKTGKVTKREASEYSFFFLNGHEVSTLVKKDGRPLEESKLREENEKTRRRIEEIQKEEQKKEAREQKARAEGKENEDRERPPIEAFLRVCQFVNPRRERFRGQDVLVFDFEPNPDYQAHSMEERVVQKLAGVLWVDEKAHQVARLEASFVGDLKIAGGLLVNLQKGTSFVAEQAFVNNEVWLPTYGEAHVGVRVFLVKGIKVNALTRYSDYRRFNVETLNTIGKPKDPEAAPQ